MRYNRDGKTFKYTENAEHEDMKLKEEEESKNGRMVRICNEAMNDINKDLKFTVVEVPEDFENERLPTLDFSLPEGSENALCDNGKKCNGNKTKNGDPEQRSYKKINKCRQ